MKLFVILLSLALSSCSAVQKEVQKVVGNDLEATQHLGEAYGSPEIAQCAKWLNGALGEQGGLISEPTPGLLSLAIKAYLLKNQKSSNEAAFKLNCGAFAAGVLIEASKFGR